MNILRRPAWAIPEREATPEGVFLNRRAVLAAMGLGAGLAATAGFGVRSARAATPIDGLFPAKRNPAFVLDRDMTPEEANTTYNNFYEFGSSKDVAGAARALKPRPWTVTVGGLVEAEKTVDVDDLIKAMPVEERLYRHRCVEAWSMTVPWTGFPLAALVAWAKPTAAAKYVRFETFQDADVGAGFGQFWYPWPYVEGLTMAEATNDLAFMVMGAYGKPLPNVMGAPLRLATPWKYGFKSIKSIVKVTFVEERPVSFWEQLQASEYGFWANVNPEVPHPRWSQASERVLHTGERVPTLLFNGYAEQVADLYKDLGKEALYM
ncbi:protein-methionine-sulfoxide reductase catalytic subunit MsrP [Oharaeibacter diazotrophicus]|uniref:Protein-methionine-sulfoxide reductase catalytic subunit MsrP n=1 Tax=Oharaeibacter diazotrophicus TaxID=1920512 RepID=A0A4R6RAI2_9HYPH|nr:protein-methionine-sulfoxide reductase catalytic subunit MsrP [Oharaeibacter diazotrophicus]TDP82647.1 sulfoxide reductase catalytic subunit YedY [Oharaeibacter diazotrophicus]BBE72590.1 sulfoxide reductase catalytic subunit YedY precursor [Pleomorphomonas sp. SM30]GLS76622.1 mononuclear molybdenum enzyme YedY [Oharaeibacter diazotrophicus]